MRKKKKLYGDDWMELVDLWKIKYDVKTSEEEILVRVRKYMSEAQGMPRKRKKVAGDIRTFLNALLGQSLKWDYSHPVWQGLLNIKQDEHGDQTLIMFTIELLPCMWT